MGSIFEKIGGEDAVSAAVDLFYEKVLADERIKHFFASTDMEKQARHQKRFFAYALGGLPSYPGQSLRDAHKHLVLEQGLDDSHFDAVVENLGAALTELGVAGDLIAEAAGIVQSVRDDVLNR